MLLPIFRLFYVLSIEGNIGKLFLRGRAPRAHVLRSPGEPGPAQNFPFLYACINDIEVTNILIS
jgi:hypothetical protein